MAIITISRQAGSYGDEIAEEVAEQLGYLLVEKSSLYELAADFHGDYTKEMNVLSKESKPGFFDALFSQRTAYYHLMASMIYDFSSRNNIVIKGRGAQFLLKDALFVINARVIAPFELRVERVASEENLEKDMVVSMVRKSDQAREEFNRYLYRENIADDTWYDVIFDTSKIPRKNIIDFLVNEAVRIENGSPMKDSDRQLYRNMALEKRIETVLIKEMTDSNYIRVRVQEEGNVTISGYLATDFENDTAEEIVKKVKGVEEVKNDIVVSQYPVKLWH